MSTSGGFSLLEVLIGTALLAFVAATIFAASTLGASGRQRDRLRHDAGLAADGLRARLTSYAVPWPSGGGEPREEDLQALDRALAGTGGCSSQCRGLPGDGCSWALALGCDHEASSLLPASLRAPPRSATMRYRVTLEPDGSRTASISVTWAGQ